jgi:hypothetical protein
MAFAVRNRSQLPSFPLDSPCLVDQRVDRTPSACYRLRGVLERASSLFDGSSELRSGFAAARTRVQGDSHRRLRTPRLCAIRSELHLVRVIRVTPRQAVALHPWTRRNTKELEHSLRHRGTKKDPECPFCSSFSPVYGRGDPPSTFPCRRPRRAPSVVASRDQRWKHPLRRLLARLCLLGSSRFANQFANGLPRDFPARTGQSPHRARLVLGVARRERILGRRNSV